MSSAWPPPPPRPAPAYDLEIGLVIPLDARLPRPARDYLEWVARRASQWDVECLLAPTPCVPYAGQEDLQVSGYFVAAPRPTLAVAMGKPLEEWFQILIHEACHMEQWHEQAPAWIGNSMPDGAEAVDWLDQWCTGTRQLSDDQLADVVARAKAVEMDCERRALAAIARHGLPVDPAVYAQKANAYVHFYDHVAATRRWNPPGQAPYQLPKVWRHAPTVLADQAPAGLREAFARHYPAPTTPRAPRSPR